MYTVYMDGELIYDPRIEELALIDPVLELALNDAGVFTFTVPPDHPFYDKFTPLVSTIDVYRDDTWIFEGRIIEPEGDFNNLKTFECEGALAYLNDSIQRQEEFHDVSVRAYFEHLLGVHNAQVPENRQIKCGAITVSDPNDSLYRYTNFNSTLTELKEDIIDDLGGYVKLRKEEDGLYLDILKDFGVRNSQTIDFGKNLLDFAVDTDYTDICTVIIPQGARIEELEEGELESNENNALEKRVSIKEVNDDKDYLVIDELYEKYGAIERTVVFDDVHIPKLLKSKAENWIKSQEFSPQIYQIKAVDFNYLDGDIEAFHLGDEIRVTSKPHGIDKWIILSKQTIHLNSPLDNTIELGGTGRDVSISTKTIELDATNRDLNESSVVPNKLIEQAVNQATQLIHTQTHGYVVVEPNEILIMDTPDKETAKNVWRWNSGGLGFSSTGYDGTYGTAITMDGQIVGKYIVANSIAAEQIDVNYRNTVTKNIKGAETNANGYTDSKLKNYYTIGETEVILKTTSDSILMQAKETAEIYTNTKLGDYYTSSQIDMKVNSLTLSVQEGYKSLDGSLRSYADSQIQLKADSILSTVNKTLTNYSTTTEMHSAIEQKADSITSTVNTKFQNYSTTKEMNSVIKQTADSITSTVNTKFKDYSTTKEMNSAIKQSADSITSTVNTKLKSYSTTKEMNSAIEQKADSIVSSVNTTITNKFKDYSTTTQMNSAIEQKANSITSSVNQTLKSYSTTKEMNSAIEQKADSITTTVNNKFKNYSTTKEVETKIKQTADSINVSVTNLSSKVTAVEAKVTQDGIFTTINNGIKGTKSITNTKFSITSSGITVQNGGITVKNSSGASVLYADTSGNLTLRGNFVQYSSSGRLSVQIQENEYKVYAWNYDGNYVGGLGSFKDNNNADYPISLWCDYGDDLILGYRANNYTTSVTPIIRMGAKQSGPFSINEKDRYGIKYIKDTWSGTHWGAGKVLQVRNGLVVGEDFVNSFSSCTYRFGIGGSYLAFTNGVLSGYSNITINRGGGNIWIGSGHLDFTDGVFTGYTALKGKSGIIDIGGGGNISVTNGLITASTNSTLVSNTGKYLNGSVNLGGGGSITFYHGVATTAVHGGGINYNLNTGIHVLTFTNGVLTSYRNA